MNKTKIKMKSIACILSLAILMAGCGEVYETQYTFIPPSKNMEERKCANTCVTERNRCEQNCINSSSVADLGNRLISVLGSDTSTDSNKNAERCSAVCQNGQVTCHRNCGGIVNVEKVCVSFCKKKQS